MFGVSFCLVLPKLRRRSISRSIQISVSYAIVSVCATFVETCALILGSKCGAPFRTRNMAVV